MTLDNVMFIGAYSARTKAYLQVLNNKGLLPSHIVLFGDPACEPTGVSAMTAEKMTAAQSTIFLPDVSEPIELTCQSMGIEPTRIAAGDVNNPAIENHVQAVNPSLSIYSGYGGQIVGRNLLNAAGPLLHMHAGWLPAYRGSTTIYYSWLAEGYCGVSAILLNQNIDEGGIVMRVRYSLPPASCDVDHVYDNALRADVLARVLTEYDKRGSLRVEIQPTDGGGVYYVIHPVLKHIALLSQEKKRL